MTTFQIKLIAIVAMTIDHIGLFFSPEELAFRVIGRLAFPLFAWLIANGSKRTQSMNAYLIRLFVFGLISQIPYTLVSRLNDPTSVDLNIFFTLFLGLFAIAAIQRIKNVLLQIIVVFGLSLLAIILRTDYDAGGVLSIVLFYLFFYNLKKMLLAQLVLFTFYYTLPEIILLLGQTNAVEISPIRLIEPVAVLSMVFIAFYNGQQGPKMKYLFYIFYPLHLFIIYLIRIS